MKTKIVRRSVLKGIVDQSRLQDKTIVFTDGCFDRLNLGHLRYLEDAKSLGDCLIVGLHTDDLVHQTECPGYPVAPEFERAEMLAGLHCVDYVTLLSEPSAVALIAELQPDVYVKTEDCTSLDQVPEASVVREYGGEIVALPQSREESEPVPEVRTLSTDHPVLSEDRIVGIIPARLAATRLPNKPLLDIAGKPMIQWVYERASSASLIGDVLVATPDEAIVRCVESFGGKAVMTSPDHRSGTDRLAEAAQGLDADLIVNIQGDEPLLDSEAIDALVRMMIESPDIPMGTMMCPLSNTQEEEDPAVVKIVTDRRDCALYFSRSRIPYPRDAEAATVRKHIGIYAYRRAFLIEFSRLEPTPLERAESLEQLRALENGYKIKAVETCFSPTSVDTPEDLERVREVMSEE